MQLGASHSVQDGTWKRSSAQMLPPVASTRHLPWPPVGPQVWVRSMHQFLPAQTLTGGVGALSELVFFFLFFFLFLRLDLLAAAASSVRNTPPAVAAAEPATSPRSVSRRVIA